MGLMIVILIREQSFLVVVGGKKSRYLKLAKRPGFKNQSQMCMQKTKTKQRNLHNETKRQSHFFFFLNLFQVFVVSSTKINLNLTKNKFLYPVSIVWRNQSPFFSRTEPFSTQIGK